METIISQLNTLFQNNQVISTVAGGSVVVWLVSNIKNIWSRFVGAITAIVSFRIVNTYEDNRGGVAWNITDAQYIFNNFISNTKSIWERTKHLDLSTNMLDCNTKPGYGGNTNSLAYGFSIRIIFGKIVFCTRQIDKQQKITVTTVMRVFFASKKKFMKQLSDYIIKQIDIRRENDRCRESIRVYNGECTCGEKFKRSMDSIFTNNGEHYQLLNSIKSFIDNKEKYRKLSYPYSYSALLYGKPGCGKSSTILAVASALNKDIVYVNLAKITLDKLIGKLNSARQDIVVFEDIDALTTPIGTSRDEDEAKDNTPRKADDTDGDDSKNNAFSGTINLFSSLSGVSLSEILNFTDGLLASDGTICLFTTNHIERLDPALLRAGRMNKIVEFTDLTAETASRMIKANLDMEIPAEKLKDVINPAELQTAILNVALGRTDNDSLRAFYKEPKQEGR